ncbi:MAG: protein-export chaperone SecB [Holosporales bacterium]|jgi:preprotein translocase subunit SecB|nr:protein-export chaperone SecB [Holosporales bacterium]
MTKQPAGGTPQEATMEILAQYIKDLSFEAPGARQLFTGQPNIEVHMNVRAEAVDAEKGEHAVSLDIKASATANDKAPIFLLELTYTGVFSFQNVPQENLHLALYVNAPHHLFPFARSILAHLTAENGLPPLLLAPVNFLKLYSESQNASLN